MRSLIILLLAVPLWANDYDEQEIAHELHRQTQIQQSQYLLDIANAPDEPETQNQVVVVADEPHCHFVRWMHDDNETQYRYAANDGKTHLVYIKVCDNDPTSH
jgi:hypothetical protein